MPTGRRKKLICNVFAENDAFTVMIRLSNEQFLSLYDRMGEETRKCIDNKYPVVTEDGFITGSPVRLIFCDIQKMLEVKCAL